MFLGKAIHSTVNLIGRNLPVVLSGGAILGVGLTAFFTAKGTLIVDEKLKEYEQLTGNKITEKKELVKFSYKYYIPAVLAGLGTVLCVVFAHKVSAAKLATMATIAKTAEQAVKDNRESIKEVFGDKGLRKVEEKTNETKLENYISRNTGKIYETGHGDVLCCEGFLTGLLFRASPEWCHKCFNDFNKALVDGEEKCYNELIQLLIPTIDEKVLPSAGYTFCYDLNIRKRLLEIVEDSILIQSEQTPAYIFTLREFPLMDKDAYYQDHMAFA